MFPAQQAGFGSPYPPSYLPGGFSNYAGTGIQLPGGGGYAYPPGSDMARFMDGINNQAVGATQGPNGGSVVDWAQSLSAQQQGGQMQSPQGGTGGSSGGGSSESLGQLLGFMISMLGEALKKKKSGGESSDSE